MRIKELINLLRKQDENAPVEAAVFIGPGAPTMDRGTVTGVCFLYGVVFVEVDLHAVRKTADEVERRAIGADGLPALGPVIEVAREAERRRIANALRKSASLHEEGGANRALVSESFRALADSIEEK